MGNGRRMFPHLRLCRLLEGKGSRESYFLGGERGPEKVAPGRLLSDPAGHLPPGAL